jgi:type VI secretion system protein ImpH
VVNLFKRSSTPVEIRHTSADYALLADAACPEAYEIYGIESATLITDISRRDGVQQLKPFYSMRRSDDQASHHYWLMRRDEVTAELSPGHEMRISLVSADFDPLLAKTQTLAAELLCSNRELPNSLATGRADGDLTLDGLFTRTPIRLLRRPSKPSRFKVSDSAHWRLISHLTLNHRSLCSAGVDELREMLTLYNLSNSSSTQRQIHGIAGLCCQHVIGLDTRRAECIADAGDRGAPDGGRGRLRRRQRTAVRAGARPFLRTVLPDQCVQPACCAVQAKRRGDDPMPTTKRRDAAGLILKLLEAPYEFEFFQAVRLLETWLADSGGTPLAELRFKNSRKLQFPASQVEAVTQDGSRIAVTPACFGLLGNHGVLPAHYGERVARATSAEASEAAYAYLDMFSHRLVALFYEAWRKHRLELPRPPDGGDGLMPLLLALCGGVQAVPDQVAAYYAAQFAHRPPSSMSIQQVLNDYLGIPVHMVPNAGRWHPLAAQHQPRLGVTNCGLDRHALLGQRMWRRDLTVVIELGPLSKAQYQAFLKDGEGARVLKDLLAMFETPTLRYEVHLVLAASEVGGISLAETCPNARLGIDSYLLTASETADRADMHYLL